MWARLRGASPPLLQEVLAEMAQLGLEDPTSKMARPHGCWQEALVPHRVGLPTGLLECPRDMAAGPPE